MLLIFHPLVLGPITPEEPSIVSGVSVGFNESLPTTTESLAITSYFVKLVK